MYSNAAYSDRDPRQSQSQYGFPMEDRSNSQQQYHDDAGDDGYPAYPVRFSRYQLGNVAPGARYNYNPAEYAHDTSYQQQYDPSSASARNSLVMQDRRNNNPNNPYSANDFDAASSTATFVEKSPALSSGTGAGWKMDGNDTEKRRQQNKLGGAWPAPAEGLLANDHSNRGNNNDEYDDNDDHQIGMNWKRPNRKVLYTIIGIVALLACGGIAGIAIGIVKATKGTTVASVQSAVNSVFVVPTATPTSATGTDSSASSSSGSADRANTRSTSSASATSTGTTATTQRTSQNVGAEENTTQATAQTSATSADTAANTQATTTGGSGDTANTSRVVNVAATAAATSGGT